MKINDRYHESGTNSIAVLLTVIVLLLAGTVVGVGSVASQSSETDEYAIVQGDECFTVGAFGNGSESVEEFYDYRTPETEPSSYLYGSYGTTHLQADDTSIVFLYEGSRGTSLVIVHEQVAGNSSGGAVTMQFDGLPEDGEWAVEDDDYADYLGEGPFDEFDHNGTSSRITWVYTDNRSDGAAFRGLGDNTDVAIEPAFNDAADFRRYDGEITDWEALSATDDGYERMSLEMNESIRIRSGPCSEVSITDVTTDGPVTAGESVTIEATIANDGATGGTFTVPIAVDGEVVDEQDIAVDPGETTTISTNVTLEEAGTHSVEVANRTVEVTADGEDGAGEELPGFGVVVTIAALLALSLVRYRRWN